MSVEPIGAINQYMNLLQLKPERIDWRCEVRPVGGRFLVVGKRREGCLLDYRMVTQWRDWLM